jgi:hypothetical protein
MARIEWRYVDDSRIGLGSWFHEYGDPVLESRLTLTQVVQLSDDPVWCVREHVKVTRDITEHVLGLLNTIESSYPQSAVIEGTIRVDRSSPMAATLVQGHLALQNVVLLLIDALVECRTGRLEMALFNERDLAASMVLALAEAMNAQLWALQMLGES